MKCLLLLVFLSLNFLAGQTPEVGYKLMASERWGSAALGGPVRYPKIAAMAGISGDIITAVIINKDGKVVQLKSMKGPEQLRPTAEFMIRSIKFNIKPEDGDGPWLFFLTSKFNLKNNDVYCFATPQKDIPFENLKKTTNQISSPPPNPALNPDAAAED